MMQARPCRSGKQQQEQNSPDLGTAFEPSSVLKVLFISKCDQGERGGIK